MTVKTVETSSGSSITAVVSGDNLDVQREVDRYLANWPVYGYGTRVEKTVIISATEVEVTITRWSSSD